MIIVSGKGIYYVGSVKHFKDFLKNFMQFDISVKTLVKIKSK